LEQEALAILQAARSIMKNNTFQETARDIFDCLKQVIGATAGYVAMLTESGTENDVLFLDAGGRECTVDPSLPMPVRGLRGLAYDLGEAVYENDFNNSKWVEYMPKGHAILDNVLFSPMNMDGETVGIIGLANKAGGFNAHDVHIATAFGELAAVALVNSRIIANLDDSQKRFRSVVESATDAIIIINAKGMVTYWNKSAEKMFGYPDGEIVEKPLSVIIPEQYRKAHAEGLNRVLDGGEPRVIGKTVELSALAKDGLEFPIELSLSSWRAGGELFFTGVIRDISLKKKVEKELKTSKQTLELRVKERTEELAQAIQELQAEVKARMLSEEAVQISMERYRLILDTTLDGFSACDREGYLVDVNDAFCKIMGYQRDELIGMHISMIEGSDSREQIKARLAKIVAQGWDSFETRLRRKDGALVDVDLSVSYPGAGDEMLFAFARDITRRNQDEVERKKLSSAVQQAAESVVITDPKGVITYVNPTFEKLTGYSASEVVGSNPNILKSGQHDKGFYTNLWATIQGGESWSGRFVNRKKDGALYEEQTTISPVLDTRGNIVNYVSVARDVSHESMLKKAREYFTAVTSRELRTPLSNMQLIKALLRDIKTQTMEGHYIENILDESMTGMERIISATSLMESLSSPVAEKNFYLFYPYLTLATSLEKAMEEIQKAGRNLIVNIELESFPKQTRIMGDQEMLLRAFDIILSNAIKYTPDGREIHISARVENGKALFILKDQGIGIDKEDLSHLFEPYFSLHGPFHHSIAEYSFKGGGMGLGLALCRMIIEHHRGHIAIESLGNNMGATVTLAFPAYDSDTLAQGEKATVIST